MRRARLEQIFEENELKATAEQTIEKLSIEKTQTTCSRDHEDHLAGAFSLAIEKQKK